jgi:hypothetical protein
VELGSRAANAQLRGGAAAPPPPSLDVRLAELGLSRQAARYVPLTPVESSETRHSEVLHGSSAPREAPMLPPPSLHQSPGIAAVASVAARAAAAAAVRALEAAQGGSAASLPLSDDPADVSMRNLGRRPALPLGTLAGMSEDGGWAGSAASRSALGPSFALRHRSHDGF